MRHLIKAVAVALPIAFGVLAAVSGTGGTAYAQIEDTAEKERQLRALIAEAIPASRLAEFYADFRRVVREAYLPSLRDAEAGAAVPPSVDAELLPHLGKIAALLQYGLRAAEEAEPFIVQHGNEFIADFARLQAKYFTLPEVQALRELFDLPAMRKAFNAIYAGSRLITDYSYQELQSYYAMTAWFQELDLGAQNNPFTEPGARAPSPELVAKAQSIIADFLRVSRLDEMVERVTRFMKEVQLQTDLAPEAEREQIRAGLEKFEFFYNLQKSMMVAVGPSALAAILTRGQLDKLHLLVLAPVTAKSFRLLDEFVREATSFSKEDIASVQKFADNVKTRGLFKERSAEDTARLEAEMKSLGQAWRERLMSSLTPETREGLERSIQALEAIGKKEKEIDDDQGDAAPEPGERQL